LKDCSTQPHLAARWFRGRPYPRGFSATGYSLDRLMNDPKLRQRAADLLRKREKEDLACEVEVQGGNKHAK
jgi:hypothetical protein